MATHTIDRLVDANGNEFVFSDSSKAAAGTASPLMDGKASVGNSLKYAREDHIHPTDANKLNADGSNATTAGVTAMMRQVASGSADLNDDSYYFGDSNSDHTHIVRRPILNIWDYFAPKVDNKIVDKLGSVGSADKPIYLENGVPKVATNVATKEELNAKQNSLSAGTGISISDNTISTKLPLSENNETTIKKGVWYIFAMSAIPNGGEYERCWDFLIASNHNSNTQMRLLISPRISASGLLERDSVIQVEGHVTPAQLAKYKLATVKSSSGDLYCCLCVNHSYSTENRTVFWNIRNARPPSWWAKSTPLSNYTVVSERLLSEAMSSNRLVCYKQTNNAAVGNATRPVYVDANGRIQACSGTLDTSGGQSLVPTGSSTVPVFINSTGSPDACDVGSMIVGGAKIANMLSTGNTGNSTVPVYFSGGKPVACTGAQMVAKSESTVVFVIDNDGVRYGDAATAQIVSPNQGSVTIWMRKSTSASAEEKHVDIVKTLMVFRTGNHGVMLGNFCPRPLAKSGDDSDWYVDNADPFKVTGKNNVQITIPSDNGLSNMQGGGTCIYTGNRNLFASVSGNTLQFSCQDNFDGFARGAWYSFYVPVIFG